MTEIVERHEHKITLLDLEDIGGAGVLFDLPEAFVAQAQYT
jgi:hypothetical protein